MPASICIFISRLGHKLCSISAASCCHYATSLCLALFLLLGVAQSQSADDVHIVPRVDSAAALARAVGANLPSGLKTLRMDVNLVLVPVTVTDVKNHPVLDLQKENFSLFEAANEQEIQSVTAEDAPLSVGLLVDLSSSMANKIDAVREAVAQFFKNANPEDDYFVITFADRPKLLADTTQSIETIESNLAQAKPKGNTALSDAIYMGVSKLRRAKYTRKALVIISDGGDNNSRHSLRQVKNMARESDAQIYAIDVCDTPSLLLTKKLEERFGRQWLTQVTESTGGRTLVVDDPAGIPEAAARASVELRNQYVLGYHPADAKQDGKWRKITVRVTRSARLLPMQVHYRTGYIARRE
jgi:Ca-activated chloride channel family protein